MSENIKNGDKDNGWEQYEPLESEDETISHSSNTIRTSNDDSQDVLHCPDETKNTTSKESSSNLTKSNSTKNTNVDVKQNAGHNNIASMKKGITSSPSFQELERAIGATLEMSLGGSHDDSERNNSNHNLNSLTQHKLQRTRQKQQYQQQYLGPIQIPNSPSLHQSTRTELNIFTNENESRAIILFHSPLIPASTVRDACQKFGVLYYIRPEFHNKGVTLLCYFDLRSAVRAKTSLPSEFGEDAEASAHYSIQLHASNSSSEEFRLIVDNIPNNHSSSDVEAIFARYGQLRSFEKQLHVDDKTKDTEVDETTEVKRTHSSYLVEFFNIQDARLAASELSATSSQIWNESATITFAPLDSRKQQLCRILLTTLSKWRSELASFSYPLSPSSPRYLQWQQQMYQNSIPNMNNQNPNVMMHPNYNQMSLPIQMMYTYPVQTAPVYQTNANPYINMTSQLGANQMNMNLPNQVPQTTYLNYDNKIDSATMQQNLEIQKDNYMRQNGNYQTHMQYRDPNAEIQMQRQYQNSRQNNPAMSLPKYQMNSMHAAQQQQAAYPIPLTEARPHHHNGGHGHNPSRVRSSYNRQTNNNNNNNTISNNFPTQNQSGGGGGGGGGGDVSNQIDSEFSLDFEKLIEGKETRTTIMVSIELLMKI